MSDQSLNEEKRAGELLQEQLQTVYRRTDRLLVWLLGAEYLSGIVTAALISPLAWSGTQYQVHTHLIAAIGLGAAIVSVPIYMTLRHPGKKATRYLVAVAQMLMGSLLIHLSGGRIETHFHIFGSLAILSFYRDYRVLLLATAAAAFDHIIRQFFFPQSIFGILHPEWWRFLEHIGWVAFEVVFLLIACRQNLLEMREIATRQAKLEKINEASMQFLPEVVESRQNITKQAQEISEVVEDLTKAAATIAATSSQLATTAAESAAAVTETTATVEEVRQTAEVSSQNAREVSDDAKNVLQTSLRGQKSAQDIVEGMNNIREQMETIASSMIHLSEQSTLIGEIIKTVDDLAQQSNLLAVNASIEAAKAGEQGRGFSVVALEVKKLAFESKSATANIRRILNDIVQATGEATKATEQGNEAVQQGEKLVALAREAIYALSKSIEQASQASTRIQVSSHQQLVGMEQVVGAMSSVKDSTYQNIDSIKELERAAGKLNNLGVRLKELVSVSSASEVP